MTKAILICAVGIPPALFFVSMFVAIFRSVGGQSRDAEIETETRPVIRLVSSR